VTERSEGTENTVTPPAEKASVTERRERTENTTGPVAPPTEDTSATGFPFVVSVHDVAPATSAATAEWMSALAERNVPATLLVIPGPFGGGQPLSGDPRLVAYLRTTAEQGHELSLHGFRHEARPGGSTVRRATGRVLARGAGEFWSLTEAEAADLLRAGLDALGDLGIGVVGFTPPGWLASPGTRRALNRAGFRYWTSHLAVHDLAGGPVRRMPALSHRPGGAGERAGARLMTGAARAFARRRMPFRIALHPADLGRPGLRAATLTAIDLALAAGGRPVTYETLVGS
jgi:predicted deacetylase